MQTRILIFTSIFIGFYSGCSAFTSQDTETPPQQIRQDLLATFNVEIPDPILGSSKLALEWVDPVASHNLNPERIVMEKVDAQNYRVEVPVKKGALLQYRYVQIGEKSAVETKIDGTPLIARHYYMKTHARIKDRVSGFNSTEKISNVGWMNGTIFVKGTQSPVQDAIISINGEIAVSTIDGSFWVFNIPAGTHNLTIFSMDGIFEPIQQQAVFEADTLTPVNVEVTLKKMVNVSFLVTTPENTPSNGFVRIYGSVNSLGNSHAGLFGGINPVEAMAPKLSRQSSTKYLLVRQFPAETEIKYLYTLGDTFWNRETNNNGEYSTRTFFVPGKDVVIEDRVVSWNPDDLEPVTIQFNPPEYTDITSKIQVQFNPMGWMAPVEMWPIGNGSYEFTVFSPLNFSEEIGYRFCRSSICGTSEEISETENMYSFKATSNPLIVSTNKVNWYHFSQISEPTVVSNDSFQQKSENFSTAVELSENFRQEWVGYSQKALEEIVSLNANTVVIPYSWTFRSSKPVWLAPDISKNPTTQQIRWLVKEAKENGLRVFIKPTIQYNSSVDEFWFRFGYSESDWDAWFDAVANFYNQSAILAKILNTDGIILGDTDSSHIFSRTAEFIQRNGEFHPDSLQKWTEILSISKDTGDFSTYIAVTFDDLIFLSGEELEGVDGIYLLDMGKPLDFSSRNAIETRESIGKRLDEGLKPILKEEKLEVWIGLDYPSVVLDEALCTSYPSQCENTALFDFPSPMQPGMQISLEEQIIFYNAAISEINRRDWINGIASRRFIIPGPYQDQSASIRGKPAADIVWYWFAKMRGIPVE